MSAALPQCSYSDLWACTLLPPPGEGGEDPLAQAIQHLQMHAIRSLTAFVRLHRHHRHKCDTKTQRHKCVFRKLCLPQLCLPCKKGQTQPKSIGLKSRLETRTTIRLGGVNGVLVGQTPLLPELCAGNLWHHYVDPLSLSLLLPHLQPLPWIPWFS